MRSTIGKRCIITMAKPEQSGDAKLKGPVTIDEGSQLHEIIRLRFAVALCVHRFLLP